jgi:Putative transposase DNA-binding domain
MDVSRLVPEARPIAAAAGEVYLRHTQPWFVGLLAHGSAVKGGFIANCSDIDLQRFLDPGAFTEDDQLPLALCISIQRDLALSDRTFHCEQCGLVLDRDLNAAINLRKLAASLAESQNACGEESAGRSRKALVNLSSQAGPRVRKKQERNATEAGPRWVRF